MPFEQTKYIVFGILYIFVTIWDASLAIGGAETLFSPWTGFSDVLGYLVMFLFPCAICACAAVFSFRAYSGKPGMRRAFRTCALAGTVLFSLLTLYVGHMTVISLVSQNTGYGISLGIGLSLAALLLFGGQLSLHLTALIMSRKPKQQP